MWPVSTNRFGKLPESTTAALTMVERGRPTIAVVLWWVLVGERLH